MIDKFIYANLPIILLAFFTFLNQLNNAKLTNKMSVKIAGYIWNASKKWPFIKSKKERCKPQPRHSIFKNVLLKQGNM